ncbi:MAG: dihydropteroate synthase [Myxococcales bacterium]|nr:dihydropteroate synthase [Myxococcales bacterium]
MGLPQASRTPCQIWGVLNVTPDSFSDGGRFVDAGRAVDHAARMLEDGAHVIDVGGESTRPRGQTYGAGAAPVPVDEELRRVVPVVERIIRELEATVSVDTTTPEVARACLGVGAQIINDVSGGASSALLQLAAKWKVDLVLMHNRGRGEVTASNTAYGNVVDDVHAELLEAVARATEQGVDPSRLWVDPGLGFAKTAEQSLALLRELASLTNGPFPVLVGASRKSFLADLDATGTPTPPLERLGGSLAALTHAVLAGARAVRVHDVRESARAARFASRLLESAP